MRKLILSLMLLGSVIAVPARIAPASAAPLLRPTLAPIATLDQSSVQTVQFGYSRQEYLRRQEFRRREAIRRERFRRREALRHGYYRR